MIICDIGNTNAHILIDGSLSVMTIEEFLTSCPYEKVYYICVNDAVKPVLKKRVGFFDLEPYVKFHTKYVGMGIDRICACRVVDEGVVVDAGSAITVDVMKKGTHKGGFILPGLKIYENAFSSISPRLNKNINFDVSLNSLPKNTKDAISYASLKSIILIIKNIAKDKKMYFTGGDGEYLSKFFKNAIYDKALVFKGLQDIIASIR